MVLAVSLFAGCAHFESIEYSQEISEENPETIEAFDQFINDIFEDGGDGKYDQSAFYHL